MPERALRIESHAAATPMPTGETIPNPVTTTRRRVMAAIDDWSCRTAEVGKASGTDGRRRLRGPAPRATIAAMIPADRGGRPRRRLLLDVRSDVVDRLLDGRYFLGLFVGDLSFELFLERHHEFDRVERVGAQIFDE